MIDLAPDVYRQRVIIEGTLDEKLEPEKMKELLSKMCDSLDMVKLTDPVVNHCEEFGICAHMHWKTSGIHMYTWDNRDPIFFSIDIYTCKKFDVFDALLCVEQTINPRVMVHKDV